MQRLLSDADRLDVQGQDAWVSWNIQVSLQPSTPMQQQQEPGVAFCGPSVGQQACCVKLHASQPTVTPIGVTQSPADLAAATAAADAAASLEAAAAGPDATAAAAADAVGAITCLQCSSPSSPFLVTGDASGSLMLWQAVQVTGSNPAPGTNTKNTQQPAETSGMSAAAGDGVDGSSGFVSGPVMQLLQSSGCSVGGVNLGGICVAVALCASAGYAAAAITCGQVRFVWLGFRGFCSCVMGFGGICVAVAL
jgi:hypothetical protein